MSQICFIKIDTLMKILILLKKQLVMVTWFTQKTAMMFLNLLGFTFNLVSQKGGAL